MYRIRLHGRGGQGLKTASRVLGTAFFADGYEVQDAPRYGAERRGAPIFAYVRAARRPIHERGVIARPDLVVVADDSLVTVASAGVLAGASDRTVLLIHSHDAAETWRDRTRLEGPIVTFHSGLEAEAEHRFVGAACAGGAVRLLGAVSRDALEGAIRTELGDMSAEVVSANLGHALAAYDGLEAHAGCVEEGHEVSAEGYERPAWIDVPREAADLSAPDIHASLTSVAVKTGLWRTMRPVIDYEHCNRCSWMCSTFCPDGAIAVEADRTPRIDYDHCKGCMICVAVCPPHAIGAIPEYRAAGDEAEAARKEAAE